MEGLTVGRIVHYVELDGTHKAAIVAHVEDKESGLVNLMVFTADPATPMYAPTSTPVFQVGYCEDTTVGNSWHWIERA